MLSHFLRKLGSLFARPDPAAVRAGGLVWHPASPDLLPHLPTLLARPAAQVKENLQRTVLRVELPGGAVFVKRSRANTPRAWARELLRPPKARLEFENAVRLRSLGLPCAEPLAWGETDSAWPGASVTVSREWPGEPLDAALTDRRLSLPARRAVAGELGRLFAALHAAGVAHPDPHPGNLLVRWDGDAPRFALLDVHAVRFGPPLAWDGRRANLVLFNRWFQLRAGRTDRARFWRAYTSWRAGGVSPPVPPHTRGLTPPARLEHDTAASNRRFWAGRDARYLGTNRQFRRVEAGAVRGHTLKELPANVVAAWLTDPDAPFRDPAARVLKHSRSSTVVLSGGLLWKRFNLKRPADPLKNLLRRSEPLRSWVAGHGLLDRHLPTARPLFVAHRYRFGVPHEGYLAFEVVPAAVELPDAVAASSFAELKTLAEALGRLVRTLHDRGCSHRDLKPPNVLLSGPDRTPVLIDLVGLTVHTAVPAALRRRDLARLNAGFLHAPNVSRTLRLRALRAYLGAWPALADWKAWWRAIADRTAAKARKNAANGRPL